MNNSDLKQAAHEYLVKMGCVSLGEKYTAHEVKKMLVEFTIEINIDALAKLIEVSEEIK